MLLSFHLGIISTDGFMTSEIASIRVRGDTSSSDDTLFSMTTIKPGSLKYRPFLDQHSSQVGANCIIICQQVQQSPGFHRCYHHRRRCRRRIAQLPLMTNATNSTTYTSLEYDDGGAAFFPMHFIDNKTTAATISTAMGGLVRGMQSALPHLYGQNLVDNASQHLLNNVSGFQSTSVSSSMPTNANTSALPSDSGLDYELKNPAIGVILALFSAVVVVGNVMVIVAVAKELYLRTVTNYFIVSLAIADVMVGGVVMPFSISMEMTNSVWLYGQPLCHLYRALDVLASTASILNLCVISLDRYWAITDPIAYPSKMSNYKVCVLITLVWLCSAGISFPAIAWWHAVGPSEIPPNQCNFTNDSAYLIISSVVSFYIPTFIMMFVYCKIYRAALAQSEGIKSGSKVTSDCPRGDNGEVMTLRIHRGGGHLHDDGTTLTPSPSTFEHRSSDSEAESPLASARHHIYHNHNHNHNPRSTTFITKKIRHFALSKKITKLAREQKAAKTLGIVVGVFIICWVPFFCANVLQGICHSDCVHGSTIVIPVFTWLGYINSGMNPIIYALSMRDFRRAFSKMIFCCPRYRYNQTKRHTYSQTNSLSTSSFSVSCGERCVTMRI